MEIEEIEKLLKDKIIECVDCGGPFTFSAGEQAYYISKRLSETKRCPRCRRLRKLSLLPDKRGGSTQ